MRKRTALLEHDVLLRFCFLCLITTTGFGQYLSRNNVYTISNRWATTRTTKVGIDQAMRYRSDTLLNGSGNGQALLQ